MVYLSVREFCQLNNSGERNIKKLCATGKIQNKKELNNKNRPKYLIPITELTPRQQLQHYKNHNLPPPEDLLPKKTTTTNQLCYEELTDNQRAEVSLWVQILEEWQEFCIEYTGSKTEANKAYVTEAREKYDVRISVDILYRKRRIYKEGNIANLVDGRGLARKGKSSIDQNLWQCFLSYYLDQSQHPMRACYDYTEMWAKQNHPQLLPLPSYTTFYRRVNSEVTEPVKILGRMGEKAYRDRCGLYIRRTYEDMASNDWWIADNHTFDVMVKGENGKPKRLYLTAFLDARSGIFTGCYVTQSPSSQATLVALRKGILKYGIPKNIYVDNGREFLTFDVGGLGHRKKKSQEGRFEPPPIFARLGINMTNALVRNAKAKIIERRFLDVKNRLSRLFDSYTGGNVLEKPERLKDVIKGDYIDEAEFTTIVDDMLDYYFNQQAYNGEVAADKGKPRMQVFGEQLHQKRVASADDLDLMLLRSGRAQKVTRRGVHLTICGRRLDYYNDDLLFNWIGKQVYYRYDPENLATVRIYDLDNRYITTAQCDDITVSEYGASKEQVTTALKEVRRHEKIAKEALKSSRIVALGARDAMDVVLQEVEYNKQNCKSNVSAKVLTIQRAEDEDYLPQAVGNNIIVDKSRMIKNAQKRKDD